VAHMNETWVMSHMDKSWVVSTTPLLCVGGCDTAPTNKICCRASSEQLPRARSCHECERLFSGTLFTRVKVPWVTSRIWVSHESWVMSHESCHRCEWGTSHVTHECVARHVQYERVLSYMDESWVMSHVNALWVLSRIWMSHE